MQLRHKSLLAAATATLALVAAGQAGPRTPGRRSATMWPFDSAVSAAGRVRISGSGAVRLTVSTSPAVLGKFTGSKVEAPECVPGSRDAVLGTDDENKGGSVRTAALCGS